MRAYVSDRYTHPWPMIQKGSSKCSQSESLWCEQCQHSWVLWRPKGPSVTAPFCLEELHSHSLISEVTNKQTQWCTAFSRQSTLCLSVTIKLLTLMQTEDFLHVYLNYYVTPISILIIMNKITAATCHWSRHSNWYRWSQIQILLVWWSQFCTQLLMYGLPEQKLC